MSRRLAFLVSITTLAILVTAGCGQSAPAPTPTKAAAAPAATAAPAAATAPAKAAEPTKPAAAPTVAAAPKVDFPQKGKSITINVPWDAGGAADVGTRLITPILEKELGVPVQVVNKPGAGSQTGLADFARAAPDGYTIGNTNLPNTFPDLHGPPTAKATYSRKSFVPISNIVWDPEAIAVKADSPIKTVKDLVDLAKTKEIKVATSRGPGQLPSRPDSPYKWRPGVSSPLSTSPAARLRSRRCLEDTWTRAYSPPGISALW